ncbi:MAG TPA: hypothetical protein VMW63_11440 [Methanoregulaceae archaeon]|nr:hypothetical protein [Methanoregulaceae archaeon]
MSLIHDAVRNLEGWVKDSGCEDGNVVLRVNPDRVVCQYEKGACMEASFGGRTAEFVTHDPIRATTRIGFMFGASLEKVAQRAAACAIINVVTGFLCISRILKACTPDSHPACLLALQKELKGKTIYFDDIPSHIAGKLGNVVNDPENADIILVNGESLVSDTGSVLIDTCLGRKKVVFLSPSLAGVSSLDNLEHWCPFGRG